MIQDKITEIINTLEKHSPDETSELGEAIALAVEMLEKLKLEAEKCGNTQ